MMHIFRIRSSDVFLRVSYVLVRSFNQGRHSIFFLLRRGGARGTHIRQQHKFKASTSRRSWPRDRRHQVDPAYGAAPGSPARAGRPLQVIVVAVSIGIRKRATISGGVSIPCLSGNRSPFYYRLCRGGTSSASVIRAPKSSLLVLRLPPRRLNQRPL